MRTRTFTRAQLAEHHVPPDDPTDHDRPYYPSQIGVFCDDCGTEHAELAKVRNRLAEARWGASDRAIILDAARDALEAAGMAGAHGDDWPWVHLSIETLVAEREEARAERDRARRIAVALEQQLARATDPDQQDFQDLQAYYAGTPEDRSAAAHRLDERALREGQISRDDFESNWGTGSARRIPSPFDQRGRASGQPTEEPQR